jgi:DNA helicase II / ATP-dependent DNA helicase PcrA
MALYEDEYRKLNDAQKLAVDTTDGPVLVIAGPGTGKTQLLSMRVASILRTTDADASNILCLTFTNKAAANMRDRLHSLVGASANRVTVKTFHGFAAELMSNNPDYFWNGARLSTAPEAVQLEIIQDILQKLPLDNPLSLTFFGQFTAVDDTLRALQLAKEAGLTPDKLRAILDKNIEYIDVLEPLLVELLSPTLRANNVPALREALHDLPEQGIDTLVAPLRSLSSVLLESFDTAMQLDEGTNKTKHVGKWKSRWLQNQARQKGMFGERRRNAWWLAFCDVYSTYRQQLHARGYYDYSDMLLEVISQLEQQPDFRAGVQERYQYVLIDEFQDSNAAQLRMAHLIASHHINEQRPNIMAVGDDDQSIYAFNGAELNNLLYFNQNYVDTKQIVLTENYRSSQAILDVAEKIITQSEVRLVNQLPDITKQLIAKNPPKQAGQIVHLQYITREQQLSEVARLIQQHHASSQDSIAVIARGHDSLKQLASILLELEVPLKYEQRSNILEHEIIQLIILLSEALVAIQAGDRDATNQHISKLVVYPVWKFDTQLLWELAIQNHKRPDWLTTLCEHEHEPFSQFGKWLRWLAQEASVRPLHHTFEQLLGLQGSEHLASPIREYYLHDKPVSNEYLQSLSAVRLLKELLSEYSNVGNLASFVQFVRVNNQNGRGIADESVFVSKGRAVELLTVHKSKGLEFDAVYVIDAVEANWQPRSARRKPPANLPLQPPGEIADDYVRLLYVAVTRAKRSLTISSYSQGTNGDDVLATPYIRGIVPQKTINEEATVPFVQILEEHARWPRLNSTDEQALLASRLQQFSLSATQLLTFLDVTNGGPQYFLERHLLKLPEASSPQQGYGSAMHGALQFAQKQVNNQGNYNPDEVAEYFQKALMREQLTESDYERYLNHGSATLLRLLNEFELGLVAGGLAEQSISDIVIGPATVNGFIDRLNITDGTALITDYKTGTPLTSFTTRDQTKAVKAWRHRTQLIFYATMLQATGKYSAIDAQMMYLEAETAKDLIRSYSPTAEDIERMKQLIAIVWQKIHSLDFADTTSYAVGIDGILAFENDLLQ